MYIPKRLYELGILKGKDPKVLNPKMFDFIVIKTPYFSLIDYQKAMNKFHLMVYIINNLIQFNREFVLSSFTEDKQTNLVDIAATFFPSVKTLTEWYPGFLSNTDTLFAAANEYNEVNFINKAPRFLLNFGGFNEYKIYNEAEKKSIFFMTLLNPSSKYTDAGYCIPMNAGGQMPSLFFYYFFYKIIKMGLTLRKIRQEKLFSYKYKLYENFFIHKKKYFLLRKFQNKLIKKLRRKKKWCRYLVKRVKKITSGKIRKDRRITIVLWKSVTKNTNKFLVRLKLCRRSYLYHKSYRNYYYDNFVYIPTFFLLPTKIRFKRNIKVRRTRRFFKLLKKSIRKKIRDTKIKDGMSKPRPTKERAYIPWKYFRYIKRKDKKYSLKFIKYVIRKKKKRKSFNRKPFVTTSFTYRVFTKRRTNRKIAKTICLKAGDSPFNKTPRTFGPKHSKIPAWQYRKSWKKDSKQLKKFFKRSR